MAGILTVDTIQSDSSYASTLNVASKMNFASGMQIGGQDATFGGMRNRIINGDMRIDQRNAGASLSIASANPTYSLDRWGIQASQSSKLTMQQNLGSVTPPAGFTNYLGLTVASTATIAAGDFFTVQQRIEGYNFSDLGFGTANAKPITISFWVYSSVTGSFGLGITNSAYNRSFGTTYTINSANTWEQKTVTIAGDTSGTWVGATNGIGLYLQFGLGVGSTNSGTGGSWQASGLLVPTGSQSIMGTLNANFYITGVQLEKGSAATAFENRHYGQEFALCQRYCFKLNAPATDYPWAMAVGYNTTSAYGVLHLPVTMRVTPTVTFAGSTSLRLLGNGAGFTPSNSQQGNSTPDAVELVGTYSGITAGYAYWFRSSSVGDWILGTAEL
jgi:hypothetical protein